MTTLIEKAVPAMATDDPKFCAFMLRDEAERAAAVNETVLMTPELALVIAKHLEASGIAPVPPSSQAICPHGVRDPRFCEVCHPRDYTT